MAKIWKIGTNINSYVDEILEYSVKYGSQFKLVKGSKITFEFPNGHKLTKTNPTASQFMRVLLSLGFIETTSMFFPKDKSVLREAEYTINNLNRGEEVGDRISVSLLQRTKSIYGNTDLYYPSEERLIFSIMAHIFAEQSTHNKKILNMRIENGSTTDLVPYYNSIYKRVVESKHFATLLDKAQPSIIGLNRNVDKIIKSINQEATAKNHSIYKVQNIDAQLKSKAYSLGTFMDSFINERSKIEIPVYQRKYVWSEKTMKTLLLDIKKVEEYSTHFIGNIVVKSTGNTYKVIDGQQRLTTLLIITRALFDFSKYMKWQVDTQVNNKLSILEGATNNVIRSFTRIEGNDDFDAFKLVLSGHTFTSKEKVSHSRIIENYKVVLNWLSVQVKNENDMNSIWDSLLNKVLFVIVNAIDSNEYKLFEKLNTGGVPLTTLELFKNFVIEAFQSTEYKDKEAQKLFEKYITNHFSGRNKDKDVEKFIITYIRENNSVISDDTIFNQFKDLIESKYVFNNPTSSLEEILKEISKDIQLYIEMTTYAKYTDKNSKLYLISDFLYILDGRSVYYPIIMRIIKATSSTMTDEKINRIRSFLRVIEIFEVRLQVASYRGQSLSGKIENILQKMTDDMEPKELWELFSDTGASSTSIPTAELLRETLINNPIANKPARLILTRLENYFHLNKGWNVNKEDTRFVAIFEKPSQREHLLPVSWGKHWGDHLKEHENVTGDKLEEKINKYVNYIGNAFPVPAWSNQKVKNHSLDDKIREFKKQNYSKDIKTYQGIDGKLSKVDSGFDVDEIRKRSKEIADIAFEIWKDFE